MLPGEPERREGRTPRARRGQMGSGDGQGAALGNEVFADQIRVDGHVGAVFAHKQQGESVAVLQAQQHQGGQALWIDLHLAGVAGFALQSLQQEAPHLLVANA